MMLTVKSCVCVSAVSVVAATAGQPGTMPYVQHSVSAYPSTATGLDNENGGVMYLSTTAPTQPPTYSCAADPPPYSKDDDRSEQKTGSF